jgi:hypothetical protein
MSDPKTRSVRLQQPGGNKHMQLVIGSGQGRPANATKPTLPISIWFRPACHLLLAGYPAKLVVRNYYNRNAIIAGPPAADGAVTNEYFFRLSIDCKAYGTAITMSFDHAGNSIRYICLFPPIG